MKRKNALFYHAISLAVRCIVGRLTCGLWMVSPRLLVSIEIHCFLLFKSRTSLLFLPSLSNVKCPTMKRFLRHSFICLHMHLQFFKFLLLVILLVLHHVYQSLTLCVTVILWCFPFLLTWSVWFGGFIVFLSNAFCCFCSTLSPTSIPFSFSNFSRDFVSLIEFIYFDISKSVLKAEKSQPFF